MNIFFLDKDPVLAAQYQLNKHVVKMILESAQLLSSAHYFYPSTIADKIYKLTHKNHPSSVWTRYNLSNYQWLCQHAKSLAQEYTYRYDKTHKCESLIDLLTDNPPKLSPATDISFPALAMPDVYKCDDFVKSYRDYYILDKFKKIPLQWGRREIPHWCKHAIPTST